MKVLKVTEDLAVNIEHGGITFWVDVWLDKGEPTADWNQYIFRTDNSKDMEIRDFQDDAENASEAFSLAIDALEDLGYIREVTPGVWATKKENTPKHKKKKLTAKQRKINNAKQRAYYHAHKEQFQQYTKKYREKNTDKIAAYKEANREQACEYAKGHYRRNREKRKKQMLDWHKRRIQNEIQ